MRVVRYLALGDSYTIGTGASSEASSFPMLLARELEKATGTRVSVQNPAVNGYTTRDLIDRELPRVVDRPDLVTILIGANDIVQGEGLDQYRANLRVIDDFVGRFELGAGRVAAISVPDFSAMPAALPFGTPESLRLRIEAFNTIAREEAGDHRFAWIDIAELSRSAIHRADWVSDDRLHPADAQYRAWAGYIWPRLPEWTSLEPS